MDVIYVFFQVLQAAYGALDFIPIADGSIHRFHIPGDHQGSENGAYRLFPGFIVWGWYGTWTDGQWHHWTEREPSNSLEARLIAHGKEQAKHQVAIDEQQRYRKAAKRAQQLWNDAGPADPYHPYLFAKGCLPHGLRQQGEELLVPIYHAGHLVNLQIIGPDGAKRFLFGGQVKGAYAPIGHLTSNQSLIIAEGWATGATLHEDTGTPVACAMSCGNLLPVGVHLRQRYPDINLLIAGDDDRRTEGNPGRTAATKAAAALGCDLKFPRWPINAPLGLSDFNDLRLWETRQ